MCATILVLQRIVYPRATCGIFTRVSMLFILSSVWIIFKVITKEPVVTIAVVSVFYLCLMVGSRGEVLEKGIVALGAYLVAKVLTWIGVIVVGLLVYPFAAYGYYDVIVILGRVILHTIALIALAFAIKKSGFSYRYSAPYYSNDHFYCNTCCCVILCCRAAVSCCWRAVF